MSPERRNFRNDLPWGSARLGDRREDVTEDALLAVPLPPDDLHRLAQDVLRERPLQCRAEGLPALGRVNVQQPELVCFLLQENIDCVAVGDRVDLSGERHWETSAM